MVIRGCCDTDSIFAGSQGAAIGYPARCGSDIDSRVGFSEELIQFLVKVLLILDRLDEAVTHLDKAIVLDDEAADGTCGKCLRWNLTIGLATSQIPPIVQRIVHGLTGTTRMIMIVLGSSN